MVLILDGRTYGVNQVFRFVEGIRLHRQSRQIRIFIRKKTYFYPIRALTCSELPSYINTMRCACVKKGIFF